MGIKTITTYHNPALTIVEQIQLLEKRGLVINDHLGTAHYLKTIGFYHLSHYFHPFLSAAQQFKEGICFSDVLDLYIFDRELRLLVSDALERIEVALKASVSNVMSLNAHPHWYMDKTLFLKQNHHELCIHEIQKQLAQSKEDFLLDYYERYDAPHLPPSWLVMECITFGVVSKIYANIKDRKVRKEIADHFGVFSEILKSWMKNLTYIRNICAHHGRLWNRHCIIAPAGIDLTNRTHFQNKQPFYLAAFVIDTLNTKIAPHSKWKNRLHSLFEEHPHIDFMRMGFFEDWRNDPFFKT